MPVRSRTGVFNMAKSKGKDHERVDITCKEVATRSTMGEVLQAYVGERVAIICARFNYMGTVSSVGSDHVILANAYAVEESGPSSGERAITTDCVTSSVVISLGAVEIVFQPRWCFADMD